MSRNNTETKMFVDCPACNSGNFLIVSKDIKSKIQIECEDCGFPLCEVTEYSETISHCLVCNCSEFYKKSSFNPFSEIRFECFLCEAIYYGEVVEKYHDKFNEKIENKVKNSENFFTLQKRLDTYYE